jgi:hypothetical protein
MCGFNLGETGVVFVCIAKDNEYDEFTTGPTPAPSTGRLLAKKSCDLSTLSRWAVCTRSIWSGETTQKEEIRLFN